MFSFALYLFSFAANTLVALTAPADLLREYVLVYNIASVIFSVGLFVYFSQFATARRSIILVAFFSVAISAVGMIVGWYEAIILAYPGLLILSDYLVTQSHEIRTVTAFRIATIISAAPFLIRPAEFAINIGIRAGLLLSISIGLAIFAKECHRLSVKSPVKFQIGNYIFYNGTLLLMAVIVKDPNSLRWWYLGAQVGLVLILKVLDYSLRRAYSMDVRTRTLAMTAAAIVPLAPLIFHPNFLALGLFFVGYVGLTLTGRYITK